MAKLKTYDAGDVSVVIGTRALSGLAEGTFVTVARAEQTFTKVVGADGEVTRSKTNNKSGTYEITLLQGSSDNAFLSALHLADENTGAGIFPAGVKDNSGSSLHFGQQCWIQKPADAPYGRDAAERVWTIEIADMETFIGGN